MCWNVLWRRSLRCAVCAMRQLYSKTHVGTKRAVETYFDEVRAFGLVKAWLGHAPLS